MMAPTTTVAQEAVPVANLGGGFSGIDWAIVFGTLVLITIIGHKLTGRISTVRDFYLGGRRLPWYAVSASLIATEISAVTFFAVPSQVWGENGSIAYLQIGLFSALIARLVIATVLAPAYYEREVYSPYDFMGHRLGRSVRRMTSVLFMIGGTLAQAARVYITAVVIEVLAYEQLRAVADVVHIEPLALAIIGISLVALLWTWIGGVATVVWTDAMLFLLFVGGIGAILVTLHNQIVGGLGAGDRLGPGQGPSSAAHGRLGGWGPRGDSHHAVRARVRVSRGELGTDRAVRHGPAHGPAHSVLPFQGRGAARRARWLLRSRGRRGQLSRRRRAPRLLRPARDERRGHSPRRFGAHAIASRLRT